MTRGRDGDDDNEIKSSCTDYGHATGSAVDYYSCYSSDDDDTESECPPGKSGTNTSRLRAHSGTRSSLSIPLSKALKVSARDGYSCLLCGEAATNLGSSKESFDFSSNAHHRNASSGSESDDMGRLTIWRIVGQEDDNPSAVRLIAFSSASSNFWAYYREEKVGIPNGT
jgi:hypothetical protein